MTLVIRARNVNDAYDNALVLARLVGVSSESRNGPVIKFPGPVITEYLAPCERVLWDPVRDVNSVFHMVESFWMLAGRSDAAPLLPFNSRMGEFAEEDGNIHGAYGQRWRFWFTEDQIQIAIEKLRSNRRDRRVVIGMWDPSSDNDPLLRDVPCNTHIYFNCREGAKLDMTVCCRSNDMVWGAYGANVVHMSILHEIVAAGAGLKVGTYAQFSNDFHLYAGLPNFNQIWNTVPDVDKDEYGRGVPVIPLLREGELVEEFIADCTALLKGDKPANTYFMTAVAYPLIRTYLARKIGVPWKAMLDEIPPCDWTLSFLQWATRRDDK